MADMMSQWLDIPHNQWFLTGMFIAFLTGAYLGGLFRSKMEKKVKSILNMGDKAFFKGIQYILSNDHDHAIEEFTKSVQINSNTIETYVALGNLYRSRGDIDRAIRIRQSIILRPNLDESIKLRAVFDLGLDYRKGGFLTRALNTFLKAENLKPDDTETLLQIENIYEEMKDWDNAFNTGRKIQKLVSKGDHNNVLAHHLVELGKISQESKNDSSAISYYKKSLTYYECIDAYLHLGDLYFARQDYKKAISTWEKIAYVAPQFTFLAYKRLEGAYSRMENLKPVETFLKECVKITKDPFIHVALARYMVNANDIEGALEQIDNAISLAPAFWEARKFKGEILLNKNDAKDIIREYKDLLSYINIPYHSFQCSKCGLQPVELLWRCPQCKSWDTIFIINPTGPRHTQYPDYIKTIKVPDNEIRDQRLPDINTIEDC